MCINQLLAGASKSPWAPCATVTRVALGAVLITPILGRLLQMLDLLATGAATLKGMSLLGLPSGVYQPNLNPCKKPQGQSPLVHSGKRLTS